MYTDAEMMDALQQWAAAGEPVRIDEWLPPLDAFQLLGALQLAMRHPEFPPHHATTRRAFAERLVERIAPEEGPLRQLALRGFDPQYDRPAAPQPVQPREPDAEERVVFAIGRGAGGVTSLLLGVPAGAWEYMKDGKTHHLDLTRIGIPLQLILYGGKDHAACKQVIDEHNARQGVASVDMRGKDFGIKPNGGRDGR